MSSRNNLSGLLDALKDGWPFDLLAGESIKILPSADDRGYLQIGNGTKDMDVKVYLGSTSNTVTLDVGNSSVTLAGVTLAFTGSGGLSFSSSGNTTFSGGPVVFSGSSGPRHKVTNITANATLNTTQLCGHITNRGATGAVVITLPDAANVGDWFEYWGVANQDVTFQSQTVDTLLAGLNDAAADSLAFSTAGEKIGARATGLFDGTQWHIQALKGTATIVTA